MSEKLTKEQLESAWSNYFKKFPEEMQRMKHLQKVNPDEFRALVSNLPGATIRHPANTAWFLAGCMGAAVFASAAMIWLAGAVQPDAGWKAVDRNNALPNVLQVKFGRK